MARFDKYSLPHALDTFSNGNIGRMEHLTGNNGMPFTGGSIAMIGDLKLLNSSSINDQTKRHRKNAGKCFKLAANVPAFINPL